VVYTGYIHQGPAAVRYPRGTAPAPLPSLWGCVPRGGHMEMTEYSS
jgi:hypothetical protein